MFSDRTSISHLRYLDFPREPGVYNGEPILYSVSQSNLHKEIITIHYFMKLMLNFSSMLSSETLIFKLLQVATALLVADSTLTFWIPWQTPFASTGS